jgi:hypothetical protein
VLVVASYSHSPTFWFSRPFITETSCAAAVETEIINNIMTISILQTAFCTAYGGGYKQKLPSIFRQLSKIIKLTVIDVEIDGN